ncbi:hypothetical protein Avbf_11653 [Armadillidium vulgare]|nr:hypothetical protein Avbf_11653 [Armadillidium vulgare]
MRSVKDWKFMKSIYTKCNRKFCDKDTIKKVGRGVVKRNFVLAFSYTVTPTSEFLSANTVGVCLLYPNDIYHSHVIMNLMDQVLGRCSQKTKDDILKTIRTTNHHCSSGAIILQFLYDSEVILQKKHWVVCSLIPSLRPCFPSVEKFVFDWYGWKNSISLLKRLLPLLPNLKVFKCVVTNHTSFLLPLRNSCPNLVDLALCVKQGFFTPDQLSNLFFCGKSIDSVKRSYIRLENVKLSFPNLKIFSFNGTSFEQYDFFKMFLHFYNKTSLGVGLYYTKMYMERVSWFDAVLSHSVVINPDSSISQCELNINDLFLPFFERSLLSWKNLRCLLLSLGVQGKKTPATSSKIGLRLESLFEKQKRIDYLCIRICGPVNDEELSELLYPTLKKHGNRLKKLKIFGIVNFLSHKSIFQMLNFCPNIRNLTIIGRRITKFSKDIRLKNLSYLESLTVIWSEFDPNSNCPMFNSKLIVDILRCSPNLKYFYSTANLMLLEYMT